MDAQLLLDQNKQIQFEKNKTKEVMQQTAWGPLTNMFKRLKNVGKFLTFQGIGSGILNPEKEEIAQRAKAETDEILSDDTTDETLTQMEERENILYNF